jgi:hypothetical protein
MLRIRHEIIRIFTYIVAIHFFLLASKLFLRLICEWNILFLKNGRILENKPVPQTMKIQDTVQVENNAKTTVYSRPKKTTNYQYLALCVFQLMEATSRGWGEGGKGV